jgi:hypothetical protein
MHQPKWGQVGFSEVILGPRGRRACSWKVEVLSELSRRWRHRQNTGRAGSDEHRFTWDLWGQQKDETAAPETAQLPPSIHTTALLKQECLAQEQMSPGMIPMDEPQTLRPTIKKDDKEAQVSLHLPVPGKDLQSPTCDAQIRGCCPAALGERVEDDSAENPILDVLCFSPATLL